MDSYLVGKMINKKPTSKVNIRLWEGFYTSCGDRRELWESVFTKIAQERIAWGAQFYKIRIPAMGTASERLGHRKCLYYRIEGRPLLLENNLLGRE